MDERSYSRIMRSCKEVKALIDERKDVPDLRPYTIQAEVKATSLRFRKNNEFRTILYIVTQTKDQHLPFQVIGKAVEFSLLQLTLVKQQICKMTSNFQLFGICNKEISKLN